MRELLEAVLNGQPRIAVRINAAGGGAGPLPGHFPSRLGAQRCRRQDARERGGGAADNPAHGLSFIKGRSGLFARFLR